MRAGLVPGALRGDTVALRQICPHVSRLHVLVWNYHEERSDGAAIVARARNRPTPRLGLSAPTGVHPAQAGLHSRATSTSVGAVYYEEGEGSAVRVRRFRLTPDGIVLLPL